MTTINSAITSEPYTRKEICNQFCQDTKQVLTEFLAADPFNLKDNLTQEQAAEQTTAFKQRFQALETTRDEKLERLFREKRAEQSQAVPFSVDRHPITYITVKFDAGYGNFLSICGTGPNMSWDSTKALPLRCVGDDLWVFETTQTFEQFEYKILMNNKTWEKGASNHSIQRDTPVQITPRF